jgi:hypothetical protein
MCCQSVLARHEEQSPDRDSILSQSRSRSDGEVSMEPNIADLTRIYAADLLGFSACGVTLITFAQRRMWPMRIFAIAANILFIGYGAIGLLYPVLLLHLVLLPLNVIRLIQIATQEGVRRTPGLQPSQRIFVPHAPEKMTASPLFGGGQGRGSAGSLGAQFVDWDFIRPAPP